jgi:hypothetical protein
MRGSRLLALTGPLFFVLFAVAIFAFDGDGPGAGASAQTVVGYARDHDTDLLVNAFGGAPLAALVVVFFSHLRAVARQRVGAEGAGPTVMVAGAVLWSAGMLFGSTLDLAALDMGDKRVAGAAQALNLLLEASWLPFIVGIAITLIGAGMTALGTGVVPRWLGWIALVVGIIGLAGPGGFACFFVGPLFMLVAGIMLYVRQDEPAVTA